MTRPGHRSPAVQLLPISLLAATLFVAATGAGAQGLPTQPAVRPRLERMIRDTVLANGLTVIVAENHASPVATVEIAVRTGAFTQVPGEAGVAHLFEHILFRAFGSETAAWQAEVAAINGMYNGGTSTESVSYYITGPSQGTERATALLAKLVIDPDFRAQDIADEIKVVTGEYERNASDPSFSARELGERTLWGDAWPRKDALGKPVNVGAIKAERLREIYGRFYVPNNAAVIVTGDVSTAAAIAWVVKRFAGWKRGPDPFATPIPDIPPLRSSVVLVVPADVPQVSITIQWHGPSARTDVRNTYVADVFSDMLNTTVSSFQERLVLSGLFQGLGVNYFTQGHTGPISVGGVTTVQRSELAIAALRNEIAKFGNPTYLNADLFAIAKKRRAVQTEYGLERGSALAHSLGFWWSVTGIDYFRGYVDNMRTVTLPELHTYVARYIRGKPFVVTAVVPRASEAILRPVIEAAFAEEAPR